MIFFKLARFVISPLDVIKIRLQLQPNDAKFETLLKKSKIILTDTPPYSNQKPKTEDISWQVSFILKNSPFSLFKFL